MRGIRIALSKVIVFILLCSVLIPASLAGAQAYFPPDGGWTSAGPGTHAVTDAVYGVSFSYDINDTSVWNGQSWEISTVAADSASIDYHWRYSGLHAWFLAESSLTAFVEREGVRTTDLLYNNTHATGGFAGTGVSRFEVQAGDRYGFIVTGSNYDSNSFLRGSLEVSTAPLIQETVSGTIGNGGWYTSDVGLSWTLTDPAAGEIAAAGCGPATITADTTVTGVTYSCTASSAGGTAARHVTVKRDTAPPVTTDDAPEGPVAADVIVQLAASDAASGVAATYYTVNGGAQETGTSVGFASDGTHTLTYWSADHAGNVESPRTKTITIIKSGSAPVTFQADREHPTNQDVVLTLAYPPYAADKQFSYDGQTWLPYEAPLTVAENRTIYARYRYGNDTWSSVSQYTVGNIDKVAPTVSMTINGGAAMTNDAAVSLTIDDGNSGAIAMQFSHDNGTWSEWEVYRETVPFALPPGEGEKRVYVRLKDAAGNASEPYAAAILLDDRPPVVTLEPYDGTTPTNRDITVYASADEGSLNASSHTFAANGTFAFVAADAAGNVTTVSVTIANIDKEAPATTAELSVDPVTRHVAVELNASDNGAGVSAIYYTVDGEPHAGNRFVLNRQGAVVVTYWSVDAAGNIEPANSLAVKVDILQPDPNGRIALDAIVRLLNDGSLHELDMNGDLVFDKQDIRIMLANIT